MRKASENLGIWLKAIDEVSAEYDPCRATEALDNVLYCLAADGFPCEVRDAIYSNPTGVLRGIAEVLWQSHKKREFPPSTFSFELKAGGLFIIPQKLLPLEEQDLPETQPSISKSWN